MIEQDMNGELSEGWEVACIGEICHVNPPKVSNSVLGDDAEVTFVPMPAIDAFSGTIFLPESREFAKVRKGYTSFIENDVLFAKITPCMENGKAAIARQLLNGYGFGSTEYHVLRTTSAIIPEFIYHFIRQDTFRKAAREEMSGSVGQLRVPPDFLSGFQIHIPPLAEQYRIVEKIDVLLSQVNATKVRLARVPDIMKKFRQSVLSAACSGRLSADWREQHPDTEPASALLERIRTERKAALGKKYQEPEPIDTEDLPELPEGWCWTHLNELAAVEANAITDGPFGSNLKTCDYTSSGPRVIRLQNIGDSVFHDHHAHISEDHYIRLKKHWVEAGDLVIAAMGAPPPRACIVPEHIGPAVVKADCVRFKPAPSVASAQFLGFALNTDMIKNLAASVVHGVSRPRLNLGEVKQIQLPLAPLEEQQEIVRRVDALLKLANAIETRVLLATTSADKLTQAVLARAFRGELVPTEAELARIEGRDYEPASVLLERVRKERETSSKPNKTRKTRKSG